MEFQPADLVFAKVRGYPAWPARISSVSGNICSVVFFGTHEMSSLGLKNIWAFNQVTRKKFATKYHMQKTKFAQAMKEILYSPQKVCSSVDFAGSESNKETENHVEICDTNNSKKIYPNLKKTNVLKQRDTNKNKPENNVKKYKSKCGTLLKDDQDNTANHMKRDMPQLGLGWSKSNMRHSQKATTPMKPSSELEIIPPFSAENKEADIDRERRKMFTNNVIMMQIEVDKICHGFKISPATLDENNLDKYPENTRDKLKTAIICVKNAEKSLADFLDSLKTDKCSDWNREQESEREEHFKDMIREKPKEKSHSSEFMEENIELVDVQIEAVEKTVGELKEGEKGLDEQEEDTEANAVKYIEVDLNTENYVAHSDPITGNNVDQSDPITENNVNHINTNKVIRKGKVEKKKKKVVKERDTNKSLLEDEAHTIKMFREKISVKNGGFACKFCQFGSGSAITAKTHALSCGLRRQKGVKKQIIISCTECTEKFKTKRELNVHFKNSHQISKYTCSKCGKEFTTRNKFIIHLRIHDTNYVPGFKCDFCSSRSKDDWHKQRHMMTHFKDTNVKSLNAPLEKFGKKKIIVSSVMSINQNILNSMYMMTIKDENCAKDSDLEDFPVDWPKVDEHLAENFQQLGLSDSDWSDWLAISNVLNLSPFENCMSWVHYSKEGNTEEFIITTQERIQIDTNLFFNSMESCEPAGMQLLDQDVAVIESNLCSDGMKISDQLVDEIVCAVLLSVDNRKFRCDICGKIFADNAHIKKHKLRMHGVSIPCSRCHVYFSDKQAALLHQRTCLHKCTFPDCSYQTKHKHDFVKHLKGHEQLLRRFW